MKGKMKAMMKVMMSMRKMMEVNFATAVAARTTTERDSIHSPCFNQESRPILDVVCQGGKATANTYEPHYVQV